MSVRKLRRNADVGDYIAIALMDLPFWLLFAGCLALGMVHWLAGAVAVGILLSAFFFWDRSKSRYECDACAKQFPYEQTIQSPGGGV